MLEAANGFEKSEIKTNTITAWHGDWASFKRRLRAAGILNGVRDAMRAGEDLAENGAVISENVKDEAIVLTKQTRIKYMDMSERPCTQCNNCKKRRIAGYIVYLRAPLTTDTHSP